MEALGAPERAGGRDSGGGGLSFGGPSGACRMGPTSNAFSSWTTADFPGLREGGAAVHAVSSDTILAILRSCFSLFPAGSETIHGAVGRTCLHMASQSGVLEERGRPLPRALCRALLRAPLPPPPAPANGHVSANAQDRKHGIWEVSLSWSLSHVFRCASWLSRDFKFPAAVPRLVFKLFCTLDPPTALPSPQKEENQRAPARDLEPVSESILQS